MTDYTKLLSREIEQWHKCDPDAMSKMSQAAIWYALRDAKHDILVMHDALQAHSEGEAS